MTYPYPTPVLFKPLNVLLVLRGAELYTGLVVWPHQSQVQRENNFPSLAGHTVIDTSQDATVLGRLGMPWLKLRWQLTSNPF